MVPRSFYEHNNIDDLVLKIHDWAFDRDKLLNSSICCKEVMKKFHVNYQIKVIRSCLKAVCNDKKLRIFLDYRIVCFVLVC